MQQKKYVNGDTQHTAIHNLISAIKLLLIFLCLQSFINDSWLLLIIFVFLEEEDQDEHQKNGFFMLLENAYCLKHFLSVWT